MIKFEHTEVYGWEAAIRGMRNPLNSWAKSDSGWNHDDPDPKTNIYVDEDFEGYNSLTIGPNDQDLMKRLRDAGTDHRKFMRMINVTVDITAPLYWWKEFDTYKVGTVANSCSTMHKIHANEFTLEDFSCEHLLNDHPSGFEYPTMKFQANEYVEDEEFLTPLGLLGKTIEVLNVMRYRYLKTKDKIWWWQMIQLLPTSYNQKRTVMLNYEVLANIYKSRKNHKLDEWSVGFIQWIESLPYSEIITGKEKKLELNPEAGITNEEAWKRIAITDILGKGDSKC